MHSFQGPHCSYIPSPDGRCEVESQLSSRQWFAAYTLPQNERWILRQLEVRQIEAFLPTYEVTKVWKNRQRVKLAKPLFPAYLFVHVDRKERVRVLEVSGVICIVGNSRGPLPLDNAQIEYLRSDACRSRLEPFEEIPIGTRVRVKHGPLKGVQGVLVNRKNSLRLVITIELINQCAGLEVAPGDVEPILPPTSGQSWRFGQQEVTH